MAKAIVIRENNFFKFMNTDNIHINKASLELRSRLNSGDIQYYEMDLDKDKLEGRDPIAFLQVLNLYPDVADKTDILTKI